jgi:hypothetical protein
VVEWEGDSGRAWLAQPPDPLNVSDPATAVAGRLDRVADGLEVDRALLAEWCLVGAVEMGVSAAAHGDQATVQRCQTHAAVVAPHLP